MSETAAAATRLLRLLQHLPRAHHAVAYGSGVFHQPDLYGPGDGPGPMIDFILAADDPVQWHAQNIEQNSSHYSFMEWLGPAAVSALAANIGAGVYFNTLVPLAGQVVKYGVVSTRDLVDDLLTWRHLYVAGRLHKPVLTLEQQPEVQAANRRNLQAAAATALLLSGERFTTTELLQRVCALSYTGDVRMGLAEDGNKVARIVSGSRQGLLDMYQPLLQQGEAARAAGTQQLEPELWQQDTSRERRLQLLAGLPAGLLRQLAALAGRGRPHVQDLQGDERLRLEVAHAALHAGRLEELLHVVLGRLVGTSSMQQAVAGVLMAGPLRSARYLAAKVSKAWRAGGGA